MKEQNELLEAALKLAERVTILHKHGTGMMPETLELVTTIERHRPKPERLEGWVSIYPHNSSYISKLHSTEDKARRDAGGDAIRVAVHMKEVVPVEWERWKYTGRTVHTIDSTHLFRCENSAEAEECVNAHNAEMERLANA